MCSQKIRSIKTFDVQNDCAMVFSASSLIIKWESLCLVKVDVLAFTEKEPENWRDILAADGAKLAKMEPELLRQGLFVLPGNRRLFLSSMVKMISKQPLKRLIEHARP